MLLGLLDAALCIGYASDGVQYVKKEIAEGQAIKEDKERDAMPKFEEYLPWVNPCAPKDARELAMKENKERDAAASFFQEQDAPAVDVGSSMANIC